MMISYYKLHKIPTIFVHVMTLVDLIGHAIVIIFFSKLRGLMATVNIEMLTYLHENDCTDGALGRGIEMVADSYTKDSTQVTFAYIVVISSCISTIVVYLLTNLTT